MRRIIAWLWLIPVPLAFGIELLIGAGWPLIAGNVLAAATALPVLIRLQRRTLTQRRGARPFALWISVLGLFASLGFVALAHTMSLTVLWLSLVTLSVLARGSTGWPTILAMIALAAANVVVPGLMSDGLIFALAALTLLVGAVSIGSMLRFTDRSLLERQATAAEAERRRIAAELHDLIAHEVTGIVVLAQAAGRSENTALTAAAFDKIEESGTRALDEIRRLVSETRPQPDDSAEDARDCPPRTPIAGGPQALRDRVAAYGIRAAISIETFADIDARLWPVLDRVLVESLTNVRRHAGSDAPVTVTVATAPENHPHTVRMTVANGPGTGGIGTGGGTGLSSLRTRVSHLGGTIDAGPDAGGGWRVRTQLPLDRGEETIRR